MTLNEYQQQAQSTAIYPNSGSNRPAEWRLTYSILALCGEAGELANKLKKHMRAGTEPDVDVLADELADVLWYVAAVAKELGLGLETIAQMNLRKLEERHKEAK